MAHRTQLYLDDPQYQYLKTLSQKEGKSIAQIIRDWIESHRGKKNVKKDSFYKIRGQFKSGAPKMASQFDDYLYGDKK